MDMDEWRRRKRKKRRREIRNSNYLNPERIEEEKRKEKGKQRMNC